MALYEYRKNAVNQVRVPDRVRRGLVCGTPEVLNRILALVRERQKPGLLAAAIDGWYGVDWGALESGLRQATQAEGLRLETVSTAGLFRPRADIDAYQRPFVTDDPSFGRVNSTGGVEDLLDPEKISELRSVLEARAAGSEGVLIVLGPGAAVPCLAPLYGVRFYADFTMQPLLWQMWEGKLVPFGSETPAADYNWKKYYYCDFYLLLRQKKRAFAQMDYYLEAVEPQNLKLLPAADYNTVVDELVKGPIKQVKIAQPGPWGSYRFKDIYDEIPGLENMAWNELAGIELSILVEVNGEAVLNIPCQNIMQRPVQLVGEYVHRRYPDLLPLQVWLDDGYLKERVPYERASMPIHNHPGTDYVKRNFNEPLGRYETYYIVEAYKDAGTMMGFKFAPRPIPPSKRPWIFSKPA